MIDSFYFVKLINNLYKHLTSNTIFLIIFQNKQNPFMGFN